MQLAIKRSITGKNQTFVIAFKLFLTDDEASSLSRSNLINITVHKEESSTFTVSALTLGDHKEFENAMLAEAFVDSLQESCKRIAGLIGLDKKFNGESIGYDIKI